MLFYMGRSSVGETDSGITKTFDMIRKHTPAWSVVDDYLIWMPMKDFSVVPWTASTYTSLDAGVDQTVGKRTLHRTFTVETQEYQKYRFNQILQNLEYISAPRERPASANQASFTQLLKNLQSHRLTEILLRPALRAQHVVMAKSYIVRPTGETDVFVYDSNFPNKDNVLTYDPKIRQFVAPEIVGPLNVPSPEKPVGLFIVDEDDRENMLASLVQYYKTECHQIKVSANSK